MAPPDVHANMAGRATPPTDRLSLEEAPHDRSHQGDRPGCDRGTSTITGVSDAQFELLRWFLVEVDDDTGFDAAAEVIARAMASIKRGARRWHSGGTSNRASQLARGPRPRCSASSGFGLPTCPRFCATSRRRGDRTGHSRRRSGYNNSFFLGTSRKHLGGYFRPVEGAPRRGEAGSTCRWEEARFMWSASGTMTLPGAQGSPGVPERFRQRPRASAYGEGLGHTMHEPQSRNIELARIGADLAPLSEL